ncbi:hypothetical protein OAE39_01075 [Akkermansiaceae bacterium]|nr:hypothetical protein [Akkermansiaceae bacterium]
MDHTRDNPLKRFTAFWIAILMVTSFGIALIITQPFVSDNTDKVYEMVGKGRLEIKEEIDRAQDGALNEGALSDALQAQIKSFRENNESKGSMPVPGAAPAPAPADKPTE